MTKGLLSKVQACKPCGLRGAKDEIKGLCVGGVVRRQVAGPGFFWPAVPARGPHRGARGVSTARAALCAPISCTYCLLYLLSSCRPLRLCALDTLTMVGGEHACLTAP